MALANTAPEAWAQEAARLNVLCDETLKAIRMRDRALRVGNDAAQHVSVIEAGLKALNSDVTALEQQLSQAEQNRSIQADELRRRETAVIDLISYRDRLETLAANKNPHRHERSVRFSDTVTTFPISASASLSSTLASQSDNDLPSSNELVAMQRRSIETQDQHLDALSEVLGRQKVLAQDIGQELDMQSDLLDDLDESVERSSSLLARTNKTIARITNATKKDRTTQTICLIIGVIVLMIVIVLLASFFR